MKRLRPFSYFIILLLIINSKLLFAPDMNIQNKKFPGEETFVMGALKNTFFNVDVNDGTAALKVWGQMLEKKLNLNVKFDVKIFEGIEDLLNSPSKDNFGFIVFNSIEYVKYRSRLKLYPAIISGSPEEYLILVNNKNYSDLKELKKKKLAIIKEDFNPIPGMWLDVFLGRKKLDLKEKYFGSIKEFGKESQAILSVFFEQNDICIASKNAFETMTELNPQVGKKLKILSTSPVYYSGLACFSKNSVNFSYKNKLVDNLIKMETYPEGRQILTMMKTKNVRLFVPSDIETAENLLRDYNLIKKQKNSS